MVAVLVVPRVSWLEIALSVSDVKVGVLDDVPSTIDPPEETIIFPFVRAVPLLVPPRAMGKIPVEILDASNEGISAAARDRKVGVAGTPVAGPAHTKLADWVPSVTVSV
jgi:hypothetical protein